MEYKKSSKKRFLDSFIGAVEDWDKNLGESITNDENSHPNEIERAKKILKEQEDFGNAINLGLGREMWYSNDFFINSLILNFITDAEDDLVNELKKVYVGMLGISGVNAVAINMDEEFEGYLINMHFYMDIQLTLFSDLVSYFIYGMQISDDRERVSLLPEMAEKLLLLTDQNALLEKAKADIQEQDVVLVDPNSPRLHIAKDLLVAGMSFVLGHEIGHHFLKHTESNGRNIVSKFIPKDVTFNQFYLDEFAADSFGFDLLIRGMKERNDNTLLAPLIVILMLALYDKTPEEPSQEHPSLRARYLNLLSRMSEHNEEVSLGHQRIFNDLATWINGTLGGYWKIEWWK